METKFVVRGVERVQEYLKSLKRGTVRVALDAITDWFIGTDRRGLRHMPPYKYASRKRAYGVTFFTAKQRRWFWANGGPDMIGNNRTGKTSAGWYAQETRGGYGRSLINNEQGAYYTRSDNGQARQPALAGWRKVSAVIASNLSGAIRHAQAAVNAFLKK